MNRTTVLYLATLATACDPVDHDPDETGNCGFRDGEGDPFADCVVELAAVLESDFNHDALPDIVLGPPGGSLDVASLGCGGSITLRFDAPAISDGPGVDLIVFENPFSPEFPEPGEVSVSDDGDNWSTFPCDPVTLAGCAGVARVHATEGSGLDPTQPAEAGGDAFDLVDLGLADARYVRIDDVSDGYWAPRGESYCDPGQGGKGGFDLDAVAAVAAEE